ncbi:hypothetical protein HNQ94_001021 [Salirhabdus euzebyi]|uniref:DUF1643 domain-containing protein n=1 Tax=Salirhabdus euzebyi TaxID=394506 RepID=A0A841PY86_9BACI|nr:DUF1643 domain-containing protein [Salirhabdus euzebyi]MBB6452576.1 hypothetical protein [Salirhabdus euzebyi]
MLKPGHRYWRSNEKVQVVFDNDKNPTYRYVLECVWNKQKRKVAFIMLNPSVADYKICDPTLNRCVNFAKAWGYGSMKIVNLFAYITPNPAQLLEVAEPVGKENDRFIEEVISTSDEIVYAWGTKNFDLLGRGTYIQNLLKENNPKCILKSRDGYPRHPLYLQKDLRLINY